MYTPLLTISVDDHKSHLFSLITKTNYQVWGLKDSKIGNICYGYGARLQFTFVEYHSLECHEQMYFCNENFLLNTVHYFKHAQFKSTNTEIIGINIFIRIGQNYIYIYSNSIVYYWFPMV